MDEAEIRRRNDARRYVASGAARMARKRLGCTLAELASALCVGKSTLSDWECGRVRIPAQGALDYCEMLKRLERGVETSGVGFPD